MTWRCWESSVLFLLPLVYLFAVCGGISNVGQEFLVVFPKDPVVNSDLTISLGVSATSYGECRLQVSVPNRGDSNDVVLKLEGTRQIVLNNELVAKDSRKYHDIAVFVIANCTITLTVFSTPKSWVSPVRSSGAYLAFPIDQLSTWYTAVTACEDNECFIMAVSYKDNNRVVMKVKNSGQAFLYENKVVHIGDSITEVLNAFESMQVLSPPCSDLTGTIVSSQYPIAVVSGGVLTSIVNSNKDKVIQQMPPIESWGKLFILRGGPWNYTVLIISHLDTVVSTGTASSQYVQFVREDEKMSTFTVMANKTVVLQADKPILLIAFCLQVDLDMTLIMPVTMWSTNFLVSFPDNGVISAITIVLMTFVDCNDVFQINGRPYPSLDFVQTGDYKSTETSVTSSQGRLNMSNAGCVFGGYLVGGERNESWSFPLGWQFSTPLEVNSTHVDSTSQPTVNYPTFIPDTGFPTTQPVAVSSSGASVSKYPTMQDVAMGLSGESVSKCSTTQPVTVSSSGASVTKYPTTQPVTVSSSGASVTKYPTTQPVTVSSSGASVTKYPTTQPVTVSSSGASGTKYPTTQPVTVSSSGASVTKYPTTQPVTVSSSGASVSKYPTTQPVTVSSSGASVSKYPTTQPVSSHPIQGAIGLKVGRTVVSNPTSEPSTNPNFPGGNVSLMTRVTTERVEATTSEENENRKWDSKPYVLNLCPCDCGVNVDRVANISQEEKEEKKKTIVQELQVPKGTLSKAKRKQISASDQRTTSTYFGSVITSLMLGSVLGLILVPDVLAALYFLYNVVKQARNLPPHSQSVSQRA